MAKVLNRSPSSISRELKRNFPACRNTYTPRVAQERALSKRRCRGRTNRLKNDRIRQYVVFHLKKRWSPEQIAGKIKSQIGESISHEAIYRFIYASISYGKPRPGFEDLRPYLRRHRKMRQPKGVRRYQRLSKYQGLSIDKRPSIVNTRHRLGDWEGDTVESVNHRPGINTLVERKSGLVFITKLNGKAADNTTKAIQSRFRNLPDKLKHTLTMDNGPENSDWRSIEETAGTKCFYAHAYHSWERGTNENTNGLIRDYYPKKTDFSNISEEEIQFIESELNTRPRKRLGWKTPLEVFSVALGG
ncbi:MAG: Transposase [Candidatus Giovannonibacteria bacterium GW2011_GWB1_45_9b]|nr:MAG: Transposase [Candidatus Giovannonibacteria bacterium GW2011_GWB1_45_9b]